MKPSFRYLFSEGCYPFGCLYCILIQAFCQHFHTNSYLFVRKYEHIFICFAFFLKTKKICHSMYKTFSNQRWKHIPFTNACISKWDVLSCLNDNFPIDQVASMGSVEHRWRVVYADSRPHRPGDNRFLPRLGCRDVQSNKLSRANPDGQRRRAPQ